MGRATILQNLGAGLYEIELARDVTSAQTKIASITSEIARLNNNIIQQENQVTLAEADYLAANAALQVALTNYAADPTDANKKIVEDATDSTNQKFAVLGAQQTKLASMKSTRVAKNIQLNNINNRLQPSSTTLDAWCPDYTIDLDPGEQVGTIEVSREEQSETLVHYGGQNGTLSNYDATRDGVHVPTLSQNPAGAMRNLCAWAGVSKWAPRFRFGTVTAKNANDTLELDVVPATISKSFSDPGTIDINQSTTLSQVPVEYMGRTTNDIFEVGDDVVVEFQVDPAIDRTSWDLPVVIGFRAGPASPGDTDYVYDGRQIRFAAAEPPVNWFIDFGGSLQTFTRSVPWLIFPPSDPTLLNPYRQLTTSPDGKTGIFQDDFYTLGEVTGTNRPAQPPGNPPGINFLRTFSGLDVNNDRRDDLLYEGDFTISDSPTVYGPFPLGTDVRNVFNSYDIGGYLEIPGTIPRRFYYAWIDPPSATRRRRPDVRISEGAAEGSTTELAFTVANIIYTREV